MSIWTVIWLIVDRMYEYTNWLNGISDYLFIAYILGILLIYIIGIIVNEFTLSHQARDLKQKYDGLLNQHKLDMEDKETLESQIELEKLFIKILSDRMARDDLIEAKTRFDLLKELTEIEEKHKSSKNNQH